MRFFSISVILFLITNLETSCKGKSNEDQALKKVTKMEALLSESEKEIIKTEFFQFKKNVTQRITKKSVLNTIGDYFANSLYFIDEFKNESLEDFLKYSPKYNRNRYNAFLKTINNGKIELSIEILNGNPPMAWISGMRLIKNENDRQIYPIIDFVYNLSKSSWEIAAIRYERGG